MRRRHCDSAVRNTTARDPLCTLALHDVFRWCRYLAGAQGVSGDLTPFLWPLRQSGIKEIYLPPLERIAADGERTLVIHDKAEHERIVAAEQAEQARLAAERAEQERIAAEEAAAAAGVP